MISAGPERASTLGVGRKRGLEKLWPTRALKNTNTVRDTF